MENFEQVKSIIDKTHVSTEGMCGIPIPNLQKESGVENEELKLILRQLYDEKYIKVREGLNGKLIFKKVDKIKKSAKKAD